MSDKLPMSRKQIAEELAKCFPECLSANGKHRIAIFAEHILRIGTTELREENKRLNAFLAESCQEMRSAGPYDGSGPCPEIMRLVEENKRLRSGEFICKKCGLRKDADPFFKDGVPF